MSNPPLHPALAPYEHLANTDPGKLGLSREYWGCISHKEKVLAALVNQPAPSWGCDTTVKELQPLLDNFKRDVRKFLGTFSMKPAFQRDDDAWSMAQRSAFMEAVIRKLAPVELKFNCPGWTDLTDAPGVRMHFECIDGLQRYTTMQMYMRDQVPVLGGMVASDLDDTQFATRRLRVRVSIYEITDRSDLLRYYLALNEGGTPHTQADLQRARDLLALEAQGISTWPTVDPESVSAPHGERAREPAEATEGDQPAERPTERPRG